MIYHVGFVVAVAAVWFGWICKFYKPFSYHEHFERSQRYMDVMIALLATALTVPVLLVACFWFVSEPLTASIGCSLFLAIIGTIEFGESLARGAVGEFFKGLNMNTILSRRARRLEATIAEGEQRLQAQRRELEADPYGRQGLAEVERLTNHGC